VLWCLISDVDLSIGRSKFYNAALWRPSVPGCDKISLSYEQRVRKELMDERSRRNIYFPLSTRFHSF
jgi:hypothetical protein